MTNLKALTRREVLKLGSLGLVAAALGSGCAKSTPSHSPQSKLKKVLVSDSRVIKDIAGLRPYRNSGFVVRSERIGTKDIVHNYGHGGAGISLCWGSSHLAMEKALRFGHKECAVLGCGIIGLTTAVLMQQKGYKVTIYAKDLPPDTTSNHAAGRWSPTQCFNEGQVTPGFYQDFLKAVRYTYDYFQNYLGDDYGVRWMENYVLSDDPIKESQTDRDISYSLRDVHTLTRNEQPFDKRYCKVETSLKVDTMVFLPTLMKDFRSSGGKIVTREFSDLSELQKLDEPLIMNCTGLGSHKLFDDTELYPIKGQLITLAPQPEVDYITKVLDDELYMIPRSDGIILGGSYEKGDWSLTPDPAQTKRIMDGNAEFFGSMSSQFS